MQELGSLWEELVNAWLINNRVNLLMVNDLTKEALESTLSTRGGRTVGQQLVHVYEVRRAKVELADKAVAEVIRRSAAAGGRVKGFKRGANTSK